eukprot:3148139-Amphidinium_carterae.1
MHKRRPAGLLVQKLWIGSCGDAGWVETQVGGERGGAATQVGLRSRGGDVSVVGGGAWMQHEEG